MADGPEEVEAVDVVQLEVRREPRHHLHGLLHPLGVHLDARAAEVLLPLFSLWGVGSVKGEGGVVGVRGGVLGG